MIYCGGALIVSQESNDAYDDAAVCVVINISINTVESTASCVNLLSKNL